MSKMRFAACILAFMVSTPVDAKAMTAGELQTWCLKAAALMAQAPPQQEPSTADMRQQGIDSVDGGYCLGFLAGLADGMALESTRLVKVCPPPSGFEVKDLWKSFTSFMLDNPKEHDGFASVAAARSIVGAYPCSAK